MRGIHIQSPLEFRLEVTGDTFVQGAEVPCRLTVKNHGQSAASVHDLALELALGSLKKAKAKEDTAFEVIAPGEVERGCEVPPGGELSFLHTFLLDRNAPISDKAQSPFLLYGSGASSAALAQLPLMVAPHPHVRSLFDSMMTVYSFTPKGETWKAGWTTTKLKAPDARRFSLVEELNLSCRFEGESLEVRFVFSVKKFDGFTAKVGVTKGKSEVTQRWNPSEYLFGGGFMRQEYVEKMVEEALGTVMTGF